MHLGSVVNTVVLVRVAVLTVVELLTHHVVQIRTSEEQDFLERLSEVAVKSCIDNGVEETVEVAQPEEECAHRIGDSILFDEWSEEGEHEERQPADDER